MSDRLPPLTALRAFDAAARHMSFAKAAEELNVTPAALSFQIKSLEDHLGQPVFKRLNRAVELTEAGKVVAPGAADAFATLAASWRAARRLGDHSVLTVTAGPGITALWLAPRIFSFSSAHPEIDLRFSASLKVFDLARDEVDIAIRYGHGVDEGLYRRTLIREYVTPMMSPEIAANISGPEELLSLPLISDELTTGISPFASWLVWFRAQGIEPTDLHGPRFNQADHALEAAQNGVGILMGRVGLSELALRNGRLVAPFELGIDTDGAYRALCLEGSETRPSYASFLDWIEEQTSDFIAHHRDRQLISASEARKLSGV